MDELNFMMNKKKIRVLFINEGAPLNPADDFYSGDLTSAYENSALRLFHDAGYDIQKFSDFEGMGIYFMNAVKETKIGLTYDKDTLLQASFALEEQLMQLPSLQAIMLMGDVAKSIYQMMNRRMNQKVIPNGSTYKLRKLVFYDGSIRIFPSYIMTGKNLDIEKSKRMMIQEDIQSLLEFLKG